MQIPLLLEVMVLMFLERIFGHNSMYKLALKMCKTRIVDSQEVEEVFSCNNFS